MLMTVVFNLFAFLIIVTSSQIPFIDNAVLVEKSNSTSTTLINQTCHQCLCQSTSSYIALNCLPNNTCQFFDTYPLAYTIQTISQARLYFLQQILPNASQCCMSNTSHLLNQLNTVPSISGNVLTPRCLVLDNHGYIVTISETNSTIVRFYPTNLSVVNQPVPPIFTSVPRFLTYDDETYYVAFDYFILAFNSSDFRLLSTTTTSILSGTRGMLFLNNGQMMVAASTYNRYILFFNRTSIASKHYDFVSNQTVNYSDPHGFWYINDTYFYLTSWQDNTIYGYSSINNSFTWTQTLFLDARATAPITGGCHLVIDECNRYWYLLGGNGVRIFDNQGSLLGNYTSPTSLFFDAIITDTYVVYLPDYALNRVLRIDLNVRCSYE